MKVGTAKKWTDVRGRLVPEDQEPAVAAGVAALRTALALSELRHERGMTQVALAEALGKSQGNVSELERRDDLFVSSLREYVEALGGRLELAAVFDDERTPIAIG
jgi:DNA-binding XRE family transcriptional regulator